MCHMVCGQPSAQLPSTVLCEMYTLMCRVGSLVVPGEQEGIKSVRNRERGANRVRHKESNCTITNIQKNIALRRW